MPDREKVIKGLHDISGFIAGRIGIEQARNFLRTIDDVIELLKEDCHNCKLECLLQKYDELKEKYDELLKEQERKKGSWDYGTQCSVCKGTIVPPWKRDTRVNFCPWCGADMRGGYDV